ncbi:MAG: nucleotidyltransferase domain-containing protein [Betaproteobacteria bacterium]|nr:nucleotidyltransferase domain-containing protein [Betaproteobacteria bacterium]
MEIARLCVQFDVRRLELFGSASAGAFDPARSDLDFLVEFDPAQGMTPFEQYFGFKESLETLFGRAADLVMAGAPQNP